MNPNEIAQIIERLVNKAVNRFTDRMYKRGIVDTVDGQKCDVFIEGNTVATPGIICVDSYTPVIGDKVLIVSIGRSGANLVILGSING